MSDLLSGKTHKTILPQETFFARLGGGGGGGGGVHKNVSQMLVIIDFLTDKLLEKRCKQGKCYNIRKNVISQISRLNLHKFGVGNYIPDC